jgi:hypothetical protein
MDPLALISGAALLIVGSAFALAIGLISAQNDEERERSAGGE